MEYFKMLFRSLIMFWRFLTNKSYCCGDKLFRWDYKKEYCDKCGKRQ